MPTQLNPMVDAARQQPTLEDEIAAKASKAPRVTLAGIETTIVSEHYFTAADAARFGWLTTDHSDPVQRDAVDSIGGRLRTSSYASVCQDIDANCNGVVPPELRLLTFCVLVLRNGFTVTGESACASPENFDANIGRKVARANAVSKVWVLMGYELRTQLATSVEARAAAAGVQPHEQRMEDELNQLRERLQKLRDFTSRADGVWSTLSVDEQEDLLQQLAHMTAYERVLARRYARV